MNAQWQYLLQHVGRWQGSFARLSPHGDVTEVTPTLVSLEGLHDNQTMRQVIQRFDPSTQAIATENVLEYRHLSRSVLFFDNGAFSQGSMQWGPLAEFGAEFGFIAGDRRLRLVALFQRDGSFGQVTLIRERREGTDAPERPPLTVDDLLGDWQGEATTLYPDYRKPDRYATRQQIRREGDTLLQTLCTSGSPEDVALSSTAAIAGKRLTFDREGKTVQVLLLPDGASCACPLHVAAGTPFGLEAGWLVAPHQRQRLIRRYDARGGWHSLTLVTEERQV